MTSSGQARTFEGEPPDPFKRVVSPLTTVPGWSVDAIKTDLMRVFNLGFGGDMSSSTIILLVREGWIFQGRSIDKRFDHAYEKFYDWCVENKKTTSVPSFELKRFKVTHLVVVYRVVFYFVLLRIVLLQLRFHHVANQLRQKNQFPKGCGKAFDTALLCKWLMKELQSTDLEPGYFSAVFCLRFHDVALVILCYDSFAH